MTMMMTMTAMMMMTTTMMLMAAMMMMVTVWLLSDWGCSRGRSRVIDRRDQLELQLVGGCHTPTAMQCNDDDNDK